jgi:hypothetical protein
MIKKLSIPLHMALKLVLLSQDQLIRIMKRYSLKVKLELEGNLDYLTQNSESLGLTKNQFKMEKQ